MRIIHLLEEKNQKKLKMFHEINVILKQNCVLQTVDDSFICVKVVQKSNASKDLRVDRFYMNNVDKNFIHKLAIEYKSSEIQKYNFISKAMIKFSTLKKINSLFFTIFTSTSTSTTFAFTLISTIFTSTSALKINSLSCRIFRILQLHLLINKLIHDVFTEYLFEWEHNKMNYVLYYLHHSILHFLQNELYISSSERLLISISLFVSSVLNSWSEYITIYEYDVIQKQEIVFKTRQFIHDNEFKLRVMKMLNS